MILGTLLGALTASCTPLIGFDQPARDQRIRYVIVGEMHGTTETPKLFKDMVCQLSAGPRPVTVALEMPQSEQNAIDAYMASDGTAVPREALLKSDFWRNPFKDGRSSKAYLELIEQLRIMKARRSIAAVAATAPSSILSMTWSETNYNAEMAKLWIGAQGSNANGVMIALVGNFHAQKAVARHGAEVIVPAGADLPPRETLSLVVFSDGNAWNCQGSKPADCGPHVTKEAQGFQRQLVMTRVSGAPYDGEITLGEPSTASPPVFPDRSR